MDFSFSNDQLLFQTEVRKFLLKESSAEKNRALWKTDSGRSDELWSKLVGMGLTGVTVPEEHGGLGLSIVDFILIAQECGYAGLAEPLVHNVMVAVPLLLKMNNPELNNSWLPKIASGQAKVVVALEEQELIEDLHVADLLLVEKQGVMYSLDPKKIDLKVNPSIDPSRRLYSVTFADIDFSKHAEKIAVSENKQDFACFIKYSGALSVAAQALGLTQRMIDLSVEYSSQREQFGKPIGSFQAVKHLLANVAYKLEYAKSPVYRAAYALAHKDPRYPLYVSHGKIAACEVAALAAKNCIQVHGAMGYTWEMNLHLFMKRAWAFQHAWGDMAFLKNRVADFVLSDEPVLGAGNTFS